MAYAWPKYLVRVQFKHVWQLLAATLFVGIVYKLFLFSDATLIKAVSDEQHGNIIAEPLVQERGGASLLPLRAKWSPSNPSPVKPWMSKQCMFLLEGVIATVGGKKAIVLEFGMGGSTAHFAKLTYKYYAIEADPAFYADVSNQPYMPSNAELKLVEKLQGYSKDVDVIRQHRYYDFMQRTMAQKKEGHWSKLAGFESYILQASRFKERKFDFVLIDGFARAAAAFYVLDLVDTSSRVAIHDFFTDKMDNWLLCDLLRFYRVDSLVNEMQPYISGGSVIVLQKRAHVGSRLTHTKYGDIADDAMHAYFKCPTSKSTD